MVTKIRESKLLDQYLIRRFKTRLLSMGDRDLDDRPDRESSLVCRENKKLRARVEALEALEKQMNSMHAEHSQQLADLHAQHTAQLAEVEQKAVEKTEKAIAELSRARKDHQEALSAACAQTAEVTIQHDALLDEYDHLMTRMRAMEGTSCASCASLKQHLATVRSQLSEAETQATSARAELSTADAEHAMQVASLREELATAQEEALALRSSGADASSLKAAVGGLHAKLAVMRTQLDRANDDAAAANGQLSAAKRERDEAVAAAARADEQRQTERRKADIAQADLREARRARDILQTQCAELRERLNAYEGGDAKAVSELKRARREAGEQRSRADEAASALSNERLVIARLRADADERDAELARAHAEAAALREALAQLQGARVIDPPRRSFGEFVALKRENGNLKQQLLVKAHVGDPALIASATVPTRGGADGGGSSASADHSRQSPRATTAFGQADAFARAGTTESQGVRCVQEVATARGLAVRPSAQPPSGHSSPRGVRVR